MQCVQPRRFAIARNAPTIPKAEQSAATRRRLDHAFLPAVRRCKTEHLNDGGSNVCQTVLGGNAGSVLCIVLDSVLDFLIIDDERNGVERVGCSYLNLTLLDLFEHLVCVAVIGGYYECNTVLIANLDKS